MITKIQQWGNCLALRIPKAIVIKAHLYKGASVDLSEEDGKILIIPVKKRKFILKGLLSEVTANNIHGEIKTGQKIGKEAW